MTEQRFTTLHGVFASLEKLMDTFGAIASEPIEFQYRGQSKILTPPDRIIISDKLYRSYDCRDYGCSRCCWKIRDFNIFSPEQFEVLSETEKSPGTGTILTTINGRGRLFFIEDNNRKTCRHLDVKQNMCRIHETNPIHCALPLIKFKKTKRGEVLTSYITREVYTRNWFMQCPAKFGSYGDEAAKKTLWILGRVKQLGDELQLPTAINQIISAVHNRRIGAI